MSGESEKRPLSVRAAQEASRLEASRQGAAQEVSQQAAMRTEVARQTATSSQERVDAARARAALAQLYSRALKMGLEARAGGPTDQDAA